MLAALIGIASAQSPDSLDVDFETGLGTAGLTARTARFDPGILAFFEQHEFRTPLFRSLHENPWRTPFIAEMLRRQLNATVGLPHDTLSALSRLAGPGIRRSLLGNPIQAAQTNAKIPGRLGVVLEEMRRRGLIGVPIPSLADVPPETQEAAAIVLQVALDTVVYRRAAFNNVGDLAPEFQRLLGETPTNEDPLQIDATLKFMRGVDMRYLNAAANDLMLAANEAANTLQKVSAEVRYRWRLETSWGEIVLSGGSDDSYAPRPTLLCIDTGGNDRYLAAGRTTSVTNWLSVNLDSAGDDRYISDAALLETPVDQWAGRKNQKGGLGPASALFGVGILIDSRGDDLYRTHRPGLASATFGAALLQDRLGNDSYDGYTDGQGYGRFGVGILEDLAGDDVYAGFVQIQGVGQTGGVGALIDRTGNDRYVANDTVIDFPSPQSAEHNANLAQGAGNGRRADYLDGHSLSGGVGILFDVEGNDLYSCGVFGQGVGYWEGVGMLWDSGGNDRYNGQWYAQGSSAHFAVGYLEDGAGDDRYAAPMNMAMGAGHDFGYGMLLDRAGNDNYQAPNLSLGAGNANGLGIFLDLAGNDSYTSTGITLGRAAEAPKGTLRERGLTLGVFFDLGGQDTYPAQAEWAKNAARTANWTDRRATSAESQVGVFWDR